MASVQVLKTGRVKQIRFSLAANSAAADAANIRVQLSTQPVVDTTTAAQNTVLGEVMLSVKNITTATQAQFESAAVNVGFDCDFAIPSLTFLHVNATAVGPFTGTLNGTVEAIVQD